MAETAKFEASIPVDLFNPGQVFACIGFVEAADVLCGDAEGYFDWSPPSDVRFWVRATGSESPIVRVLRFLDGAVARAEAVVGSRNIDAWKHAWGELPIEVPWAEGYPSPDPRSPATLVCLLANGSDRLRIDYWSDESGRDNVKFWAGSGGYPGVALTRDALALVRGNAEAAEADPFAFTAPQSSSFRLDWRRDYVPIDSGFSLNAHGDIESLGFPLVELLGAIGLGAARPRRPNRRDKLTYEYAVVGCAAGTEATWLPPSLLRAALGASPLPFPTRNFRMRLDWPGKQGQARSITTVTEETST